jgi:hypothetical protein
MTTAAALTYRAVVRMFKDVAAAWSRPKRASGPILSGLATLSDDGLRQFDEQLGCRPASPASSHRANGEILKIGARAEPVESPCVLPFAPPPLRRGTLDKKSASVLP